MEVGAVWPFYAPFRPSDEQEGASRSRQGTKALKDRDGWYTGEMRRMSKPAPSRMRAPPPAEGLKEEKRLTPMNHHLTKTVSPICFDICVRVHQANYANVVPHLNRVTDVFQHMRQSTPSGLCEMWYIVPVSLVSPH